MHSHRSAATAALSLFLCAILLTSCHKDRSGPVVYLPGYDPTGLHALMAPLRSGPQTFTVTAGTYSSIVGAEGTELRFYPHSFKNADGSILKNGNVEISLLEIYRPGDMIAHSASTVAGGAPLISGGQIHVTATQGGHRVDANKYGIRFRQPAPSSQPMQLYLGDRNLPDSVVTWREPFSLANGTSVDSLQGSTDPYYQFDSVTNFQWINCDYFSNTPGARTNLSANMPDKSFNRSNTFVWIVFPSINSVTWLNNYNDRTSSTFSLLANYYIPVGIKFHVVAITKNEGTWYYAEKRDLTAVQDHTLSIVPARKSIDEIREALKLL